MSVHKFSSIEEAQAAYDEAYRRWCCQVNVNYHDGGMTLASAEAAAGPEPKMFVVSPQAEEAEETPYVHGLPSNGYIS